MAENENEKKSSRSENDSQASSTRLSDDAHNFDFYIRFTKPLILNLPNQNDKRIASAWVEKLKDDSADEELRTKYLKLFLFVLHRSKLSGPFLHHPGEEELQDLPDGNKLVTVARDILEAEQYERLRNQRENRKPDAFPPYSNEMSSDMMQYASYQEIPKFGAQIYFATSTDPIHTWDNVETGIIPKQVITDSIKTSGPTLSHLSLKASKSKSLMEAEKQATKSNKPKTPVKPFSPLSTRVESPPSDRRPITWGSNLIEVTDPPERRKEHELDDVCGDCPRPPSPIYKSPQSVSSRARQTPPKSPPRAKSPSKSPTEKSPNKSPGRDDTHYEDLFNTSMPDMELGGMSPKSPQFKSPRVKSPTKSPGRGDTNYDDIFNTSMPDLEAGGMSPKSPQFRTTGNMDYDALMDTSFPEELQGSDMSPIKSSPSRSGSPRSFKSPILGTGPIKSGSPASQLPHVRHIVMSSSDQEALDIIEEANKMLLDQESRIEKSVSSEDARTRRQIPEEPPSPFLRSPLKSPPSRTPPAKQDTRSPESLPGGGAAGTPRKGQRTMAELFPDISQGDDDDFLFDGEPDFGDSSFLNDSNELYEPIDEKIREIQKNAAATSEVLPVSAGVSATTPSEPTTPRRRNAYGSAFPLLEEDIPDLFNLSLSPECQQRLKKAEPSTDAFGLIKLLTERSPPSERFDIAEVQRTLPKGTPPREMEAKPSTSTKSPKKSPTPKKPPSPKVAMSAKQTQSQEMEEEEDKDENNLLYETLISPYDDKSQTPKTKDASSDPEQEADISSPPHVFTLGWTTPPHLKVEKEPPPSPSFTSHLGPPKDDEYLFGETFPDIMPPDTPPRAPPPMTYDEFLQSCNYPSGEEGIDLMEEEEPLGAKLEAHEWHPYKKEKNFSIKVGARAKNVMLPRRSAAPRVETISEEAEYFLLKSPVQSPVKPVQIDYNAPYMLPSSARQHRATGSVPESSQTSPPHRGPSSPSRSPQATLPESGTQTSEAQTILEEIQEHVATNVDDRKQLEILQHVQEVIQTVEETSQQMIDRATSPDVVPPPGDIPQRPPSPQHVGICPSSRQASPPPSRPTYQPPGTPSKAPQQPSGGTPPRPVTPDLCMMSPPQGYDEIDMIDATSPPPSMPDRRHLPPQFGDISPQGLDMASPPKFFDDIDNIEAAPDSGFVTPCRQRLSPRRIEFSPELDMASPPPGFNDIDIIDATSPPPIRRKSPSPQKPSTTGPEIREIVYKESTTIQSPRQQSPQRQERSESPKRQTPKRSPKQKSPQSSSPCGQAVQVQQPTVQFQQEPCQAGGSPISAMPTARVQSPQQQVSTPSYADNYVFQELMTPGRRVGSPFRQPVADINMASLPPGELDMFNAQSPEMAGFATSDRSPCAGAQGAVDLNMASPPPGFDDLDRLDAMSPMRPPSGRSPVGPYGQRSPRRPPTPNLGMASPPPGFNDIDMIDAQSPPGTPFGHAPCAGAQGAVDLNMASPPPGFGDIDMFDTMSPMRPPPGRSPSGPCGQRSPGRPPTPNLGMASPPPGFNDIDQIDAQSPPGTPFGHAPCAGAQGAVDLNMASPPPGFGDIDMFDTMSPMRPPPGRSPGGPCGQRSPGRPPTPNLGMASPPPGFNDIDQIDAQSPPGTPFGHAPCAGAQGAVDLNMASPPPGFGDIDMFDTMSPMRPPPGRSPSGPCGQRSPGRPPTPNLGMASPPPGFNEIDLIDAQSPPGTPFGHAPCAGAQGAVDLNMASPPPGFGDIDMFDAMSPMRPPPGRSPSGPCGQRSPGRPPTPNLGMASPPPGFNDIDLIDAQSPPGTPFGRAPCAGVQGTVDLNMASPPPGFGDIDMFDAMSPMRPPPGRSPGGPCSQRSPRRPPTPNLGMASPPPGFNDIDLIDAQSPPGSPFGRAPCAGAQGMVDLNAASPPPGFNDIDMLEVMSPMRPPPGGSSGGPCGQRSPRRPPTPNLGMASPPPGFNEIDLIDAQSPPGSPFGRAPCAGAQGTVDLNMASPPPGFNDIDMLDAMSPMRPPPGRSSGGPCGQRSPRRPPTPNLGMASPPSGFNEIDLIEAQSPPGSPFGRAPCAGAQGTVDLNMASPPPGFNDIDMLDAMSPMRPPPGRSPSSPCGQRSPRRPPTPNLGMASPPPGFHDIDMIDTQSPPVSPFGRAPCAGAQGAVDLNMASPPPGFNDIDLLDAMSPMRPPPGRSGQRPGSSRGQRSPNQQVGPPPGQTSPRNVSPCRRVKGASPGQRPPSPGPRPALSGQRPLPGQRSVSPDMGASPLSPCRPASPQMQGASAPGQPGYGENDLFQDMFSSGRTPQRQPITDMNMVSPPPGFDELDMFEAQSPGRSPSCRAPSPRRPATPNLGMASPPPGFADIDMIDAQTPPRAVFGRSPCGGRQGTPDLNMASPPPGFDEINMFDNMSPMRTSQSGRGTCGSSPKSAQRRSPKQRQASPQGTHSSEGPGQFGICGSQADQMPIDQGQYGQFQRRSPGRPPTSAQLAQDSGPNLGSCRPRSSPERVPSTHQSMTVGQYQSPGQTCRLPERVPTPTQSGQQGPSESCGGPEREPSPYQPMPPGQYQNACQVPRSPTRAGTPIDLNLGSPPAGFADIDLIDATSPGIGMRNRQDSPARPRTPNICMASPPPGFNDIDMFSTPPRGSPGQGYYSPQMMNTPNLDMASPPPGFHEMDAIDAEPVCGGPGLGAMGGYVPEFGNYGGNQYTDLMNESMPFDTEMLSSPQGMQCNSGEGQSSNRLSPQSRSKRTRRSPNSNNQEEPVNIGVQESILHQVELQAPTKGMSGDSPSAIRRQIKKKLSFRPKISSNDNESNAPEPFPQPIQSQIRESEDFSGIESNFGIPNFEDQPQLHQTSSTMKSPLHKTRVIKIHRTPQGVTTTTTIETVEQTIPSQDGAYDPYMNQQQQPQPDVPSEMNDFGDRYYVPEEGVPPDEAYGYCGAQQPAEDPYAGMTPNRRQRQQLYDRVDRLLEGTTYDVGPLPSPNISPARRYYLEEPPPVDYFDIIEVCTRPGIQDDEDIDLYSSPPATPIYQSPAAPSLFCNNQENVDIYADEPELYMSPGNNGDAFDTCY